MGEKVVKNILDRENFGLISKRTSCNASVVDLSFICYKTIPKKSWKCYKKNLVFDYWVKGTTLCIF